MKTDKEVGIKLGIEALKTMRSGMTLVKAIEILTKFDNGEYSCGAVTFRKAVALGSEAMKQLQLWRNLGVVHVDRKLQGETED